MAKKTSLEKLLGYQTRLQGVANGLATKLRELLDAADDETLAMLRREYKTATGDVKSRIRAIQKLVVALEKARAAKFTEAETLAVETGRSVAEIASDATLAEIYPLLNASERLDAERSKRRAAEVEERRRRLKPLSAKQIDAILNWSPIQGASISQWFERWRENDLRRIVDEVQTGAVESLSVYELTRKIRGTKANGYADGILQTSRRSAETVARTVINGVSNEARFATLCENDDVLDGIQFLATLDGRTSFVCASLDGKIWRGDEMEKAARPPLHPNCRSTLIPYIELRDPETGEIIDESEDLLDENGNVVVRALTRAAANADFNKLAEESYNKTAREKGLKKRWDDLSPSTRKKYYYQAQRDWETANGGENAYRQVPASTTFKEYFETQPEAFQRSWLGAKRFELWKSGRLKFEDLGKPASSYRATTDELKAAGEVGVGDRTNKTFRSDEPLFAARDNNSSSLNAETAREEYLDKVFPDKGKNRDAMQKRYQVESGDLKVGLGPQAPPMSAEDEKNVVAGLDFIGRVLDNIGDKKPGGKFWETSFYSHCSGNGFFDAKNNKIRLRDWGIEDIGMNVAHEFVHALDRHSPWLRRRLYSLYVDLTTEDNGKRTRLEESKNSDGKVDYFYRPLSSKHKKIKIPRYALRSYEANEKIASTELFSMWCEHLFKNPRKFIRDYPDFYKLIRDVLKEWKNQ